MATHQVAIAKHRFAFGYFRQTFWNWLIGTAFFLGGIGGGLFLISLLLGHPAGMLAGYLIVMVGKNAAHLKFLGRPERFWRAAMRPDRSWIARGIWATGLLGLSGMLLLLPYLFGPQWQLSGGILTAVSLVAGISSFFLMFYDGFVLNSSFGVAFWRTLLLPLLMLMYATLGGSTMSLTLREVRGEVIPGLLTNLEHALLVLNFLMLVVYLLRMNQALPAARETLQQWLRGPYSRPFFGLVLGVGLFATLLLSLAQSRVEAQWLVILIAACELTGDFSLIMLLLKSGLFPPQTAPAYGREWR